MIVTITESRQLRPADLALDLDSLSPDKHLVLLIARQKYAGLLEIDSLASKRGLGVVAGVSFDVDISGDHKSSISLIALAHSSRDVRRLIQIRSELDGEALTPNVMFDRLSSIDDLTLFSGSPLFSDPRVINCVSPSRIPTYQTGSTRILKLRTLGTQDYSQVAKDELLSDMEMEISNTNASWLATFGRSSPDPTMFSQIKNQAWQVLAHTPNDGHRYRLHEAITHELAILEGRPDIQSVLYDAWRLTTLAHEHRIALGPGRGSSAASALVYALGISDINPVEHGLYPYRFFSDSHTPDIDIDIDARHRSFLVAQAADRFGLGKLSSVASQNDESVLRRHPSAVVMDGTLPRVKTDPLQIDLTSSDCDAAGIPVTDLLSSHMVSTLTAMQHIEISTPPNAPATTPWDLLSRCLTLGIPHLNTPLAHSVLKQVGPKCQEDLEDVLALMRPGASRSLQQYLAYKKNNSDPTMRPLLYQEDVYSICNSCPPHVQDTAVAIVANKATFADAGVSSFDELLSPHGVSQSDIERIKAMNGYAFSRPHAAAYADIILRFLEIKSSDPIRWIKTLPAISNVDPNAVWQEMSVQLQLALTIPDLSLAPLSTEITAKSLIIGLDVMLGDESKVVEFAANRDWLPISGPTDASRRLKSVAV